MNEDRWLLALCLWREARGVAPADRATAYRAIKQIIENRLKGGWPKKGTLKTIAGVILEPWQFSSFNQDDANSTKYPHSSLPKVDWDAWQEAKAVVLEESQKDGISANHYHSYPIGHPLWPKWATGNKLVKRIGPFWFYKL